MRSPSKLNKYVFMILLFGTLLALIISIATRTTIGFRLWLALQGLMVIVGLAVQGTEEIKDDVGNRKYLDASITVIWYGLLFLISAAFEYVFIQALFAKGGGSPRLGFLMVMLAGLLAAFLLLVVGLYLVRAAVEAARRDWAVKRYFHATVKSLLFAAGAVLCIWAVYVLSSHILDD